MTADKTKLSSLTTRQKVMGGAFVVIAIFLVWQIKGLFSSGSSAPTATVSHPPTMARSGQPGSNPAGAAPPSGMVDAQHSTPQAVARVDQPPLTQREMDLIKLQQETEAKYISALNELQLLKINQSIAETNKAIATAKLDTVTAQKGVVDLLTTPAVSQDTYSQSLSQGTTTSTTTQTQQTSMPSAPQQQQESYTVVSVSQLQYKWNAVIGNKGNLYSVAIGDKLPPDSSKVVSIDRSGVTLEKDGQTRKISLVPII